MYVNVCRPTIFHGVAGAIIVGFTDKIELAVEVELAQLMHCQPVRIILSFNIAECPFRITPLIVIVTGILLTFAIIVFHCIYILPVFLHLIY